MDVLPPLTLDELDGVSDAAAAVTRPELARELDVEAAVPRDRALAVDELELTVKVLEREDELAKDFVINPVGTIGCIVDPVTNGREELDSVPVGIL